MTIFNTTRQSETRNIKSLPSESCIRTHDFRPLHSCSWLLNTGSSPKGFTLIELIMTIIILGFASLIMIPFVTSIANSPDPVVRQRAISLGQALMDEILAKKWDENTPMGGGPIDTVLESSGRGVAVAASTIGVVDGAETRIDFDDVDDYDGLTATNNFVDQNNTPFTLPGYTRTAQIRYISSNANPVTAATPAGTTGAATATDTKKIVVSVISPRGETFNFVSLKCNY